MALSWDEIQANAVTFSKRWGAGWDEKSEAQSFIRDFLAVFGVKDPALVGQYEKRALRETGKGFMDYYWRRHIGIEMKTKGKLRGAYEQLLDYVVHLPAEDIPDLLMVSDFETIEVHRRTTAEKLTFKTKDLRKHIRWFADIAGYETTRAYENQVEVNVRAAEKMAKLHDALKANGYEGHELEVYLVRLLFCLFADDTGIFPADSFINYIENSREDGSDLSTRMVRLFEILNMPEETRAKRPLLSAEIKQFRYINGGLFADMLPLADFDGKMRQTLLDCCNFDWNKISPAIFGAMFQGVMDKGQRRELGAHYTSEENILKLINPLFLDELWKELDHVKTTPAALARFHEKIGKLTFLDPACGCGNFLILTYRELRLLELEVLKMEVGSVQLILDIEPMLKVSVTQFYGIEYEDFPCQIAQVGMWLMDHQMNMRVAEHFGMYYARLPLNQSATIVHGNALRIDWEDVVPKRDLSYILGNPPFVGARIMGAIQKSDMINVFGDTKGVGNLDYVTAWYKKAATTMTGTLIRTAFVSTNSVSQGEQVAILWKSLFKDSGVKIDFGYRTFKWNNEAKGKAAVHCVIVGFSVSSGVQKIIYDSDGTQINAGNINGYLVDAIDVFIESRSKPIFNVPEISIGNMPVDGGFYLFTKEEKDAFIKIEPRSENFFRPWIGSHEFINRYYRYCLWLGNCTPLDSENF
jgi:type I restriction-modification system DNA methylase subunit